MDNYSPMEEYENNLRTAFGNRSVTIFRDRVKKIHSGIENATGEKYIPKKTLLEQMRFIIDLAEKDSIWTAETMRKHLYFFNVKDYSLNYIGRKLKEINKGGLLVEIASGQYIKAEK